MANRVGRLMADADRAAVHLQIVREIGPAAQLDAVDGPGVIGVHLPARVDRSRVEQRELERVAVEAGQLVGELRIHREQHAGVLN